jgi:amino acid permease
MALSLARYHTRSPRYTLDTDDNNLIRTNIVNNLQWEEKITISDLSLTGLSFTTPQDLSPQLNEVIKIQFTVPHAEQMACFAQVVGVRKSESKFEQEIAVKFFNLDRLQRINLMQGLSAKTTQIKTKKPNSLLKLFNFSLMFSSLASWLIVLKIYFLK